MLPQEPKYGDVIVAFTIREGRCRWYVADKCVWFMDQYDEPTASLGKVCKAEASVDDLREWTGTFNSVYDVPIDNGNLEILDLVPVLYVDFDNKLMMNCFPEPGGHFEEGLPRDWTVVTNKPFLDLVPNEYKYWILNGRPMFGDFEQLYGA